MGEGGREVEGKGEEGGREGGREREREGVIPPVSSVSVQ